MATAYATPVQMHPYVISAPNYKCKTNASATTLLKLDCIDQSVLLRNTEIECFEKRIESFLLSADQDKEMPSNVAVNLAKSIVNIIYDNRININNVYVYNMIDGGISFEIATDPFYMVDIYNNGDIVLLKELINNEPTTWSFTVLEAFEGVFKEETSYAETAPSTAT